MVWYGIPEGTPRMAAKMGGAMPTAAAAGGAAASAASEKRLELGLLRNLHRIEVKSIYDIYIYILSIIYVYIVVHTHVHIFLRSSTPERLKFDAFHFDFLNQFRDGPQEGRGASTRTPGRRHCSLSTGSTDLVI